ncbi:hypothetical protein COW36_21760 [bacterium (Candidatus Blackallbacteria) CG17_big_fil_post_rev_8_21_14_2_50_48_46]|uniref:CheW-like domain-containing protein n=1 Tax=bacterium (Candidatus Blackallbacteria) CG17_big_fil_post_rev_8_21_14_2_50_48_46 TaxID=2014261 RepID=A0A2M7FYJ6_9BACT|nr:MAG: hypothetical protein COW64_11100 [bacterium (Candidatus Blackallbacteria) CG18_big_fil_WC_8_21_14_2_50_49_26]PIW14396.1 MAG: hypothetical protein COW36_21760 [bacterium (Candidatus Blackallbacteria) CG17_big_fil_post_rev_8_21_14_2_50_48_46]PIW46903.1 MAG: hypothetical protein COW20_14175 [bacterium (Candidatus Blackallbacteria) CG13_big_fil_rev_8_21_14_2_50_49_14]
MTVETQAILFKSKHFLFAIEVENIVEITRIINFEPVSSHGGCAQGYFYYRQETLPVVDVCRYFNFNHGPFLIENLIAVVSGPENKKAGLLLDEVLDIVNPSEYPRVTSYQIAPKYCRYAIELDKNKIPVLNISNIYLELVQNLSSSRQNAS